jgi:hypothetical protein
MTKRDGLSSLHPEYLTNREPKSQQKTVTHRTKELDLWKQNTEDHNFTCRLLIRIITPNRYTREAVNTTTLSSPEVKSEKSDKSCDL